MRIQRNGATGYVMWLSASDTARWARRPGAAWPCSTLAHSRAVVVVDSNGLCDLSINGKSDNGDIDTTELNAIVADHLPADMRHMWPVWAPTADDTALARREYQAAHAVESSGPLMDAAHPGDVERHDGLYA